jgi:hypothetical protein
MLPHGRSLLILRLGLLIGAFGWGISFYFTFTSWEASADWLYAMGAREIPYQPLMDYWLKMASTVFGCLGLLFLLAGLQPARYAPLLPLFAAFHLVVGASLVVAALRNGLTPGLHPTFIADITFCFCAALLIGGPLWLRKTHAGNAR